MKAPTQMGALRIAAVMALVGLALMMWSLFDPRPPPVLIALSVGQAIGTMSFAIFGWVVFTDYRKRFGKPQGDAGAAASLARGVSPVTGPAAVAADAPGAAESAPTTDRT